MVIVVVEEEEEAEEEDDDDVGGARRWVFYANIRPPPFHKQRSLCQNVPLPGFTNRPNFSRTGPLYVRPPPVSQTGVFM